MSLSNFETIRFVDYTDSQAAYSTELYFDGDQAYLLDQNGSRIDIEDAQTIIHETDAGATTYLYETNETDGTSQWINRSTGELAENSSPQTMTEEEVAAIANDETATTTYADGTQNNP